MYIQYQYIKNNENYLFASGFIQDYYFSENSITLNIYPVRNNTKTIYDLYFINKTNLLEECQKLEYVLKNQPISSVEKTGINYFNLTFDNIKYTDGYYLLKGNNIDDISYTYFYHGINIVQKQGPFISSNSEFFQIKTESNKHYSLFNCTQNIESKKYLSVQIFLCNLEPYSHFSILNEKDNLEFYDTDIISNRQVNIDIFNSNKIKILATSPKMYFQYQFIDNGDYIFPMGIINTFDSNLNDNSINLNITPVMNNSYSTYELYFSDNLNFTNNCEKLEYTLNNKPISSLNVSGINIFSLKFTYNLIANEDKNVNGYAFIKANNINETNYTYFYETINISVHYQNKSLSKGLTYFLIILISLILVFLIIFILKKKRIICPNNDLTEEEISKKELMKV